MKTTVDEANSDNEDWDEEFITELDRRTIAFEEGTAKTYTWEETKQNAIDRVKQRWQS